MVLGLKTRNAALAYWAEVFTPQFLRRLIISILGLQIAVAPQAFALPSQHENSEAAYIEDQQPFMPDIYDPEGSLTESESPADELVPESANGYTHAVPSDFRVNHCTSHCARKPNHRDPFSRR